MVTNIPKKIVSLLHPTVVTLGGQRYLVISGSKDQDGWYPVKDTFTFEKAQSIWTRRVFGDVINIQETKLIKIPNSKKNGYYTVKFVDNDWTCDCTGFGFRRKCRHIDEAKLKVK